MRSPALTTALLRDELLKFQKGLSEELARTARQAVREELAAFSAAPKTRVSYNVVSNFTSEGVQAADRNPDRSGSRVSFAATKEAPDVPGRTLSVEEGFNSMRAEGDQEAISWVRQRKSYLFDNALSSTNSHGRKSLGRSRSSLRFAQPLRSSLATVAIPEHGPGTGEEARDPSYAALPSSGGGVVSEAMTDRTPSQQQAFLGCREDTEAEQAHEGEASVRDLRASSTTPTNRSRQTTRPSPSWLQHVLDEAAHEDESPLERWWRGCGTAVRSQNFESLVGVIIVLNALHVGYHTDYTARHLSEPEPMSFRAVSRMFCAAFTTEMILRVASSGPGKFLCGDDGLLNLTDCAAVVMMLCEELMNYFYLASSAMASDIGVFRIMRVLYFVRVFTTSARVFHLFSGLRMMIVSITHSMRYLAWTIFLIFSMTYIFAVFCTQLATDRKAHLHSEADSKEHEELARFYGSLGRTILSLYEAVSDGIHWHEVMDPLVGESPWVSVVFTLYMSFALFALMNVVTGVFVESAIQTADADKKHALMCQMYKLFRDADTDKSGTISWEEFENHLEDPQMHVFLHAIDLDQDEARALFRLLDVEETGEIDAELIVASCMRLHGSAKAIELAAFMHEYRRNQRSWSAHAAKVEANLSRLCEAVNVSCVGSQELVA